MEPQQQTDFIPVVRKSNSGPLGKNISVRPPLESNVNTKTDSEYRGRDLCSLPVYAPDRVQVEIERVRTLIKFKQAIVEKVVTQRIGKLAGKERKIALRKAHKWFTVAFYMNLAKGNIRNFTPLRFENDILPADSVDVEIDRSKRHSSGSDTPMECNSRETSPSPTKVRDYIESWTIESSSDKYHYGTTVVFRLFEFRGFRLKVPRQLETILRSKYRGPVSQVNESIYICGLRYQTLGFDNNYLSIPPTVSVLFDMELFGSPFNTTRPYFSPFPDIESCFGSLGNFFSTPFPVEMNKFTFNPPYDETVIEMAATKLIEELKKRHITILCVLPVWDPETQCKLGTPMLTDRKEPTRDPSLARPFRGLNILRNSGFIKEWSVRIRDVDHPFFYDYLTGDTVLAVTTHMIMLSSGQPHIGLRDVFAKWLRPPFERT